MPLSAGSSLNKALDIDTFGALATAVADRIDSVTSAAWGGEQKFNGVVDAMTVDVLAAHVRSRLNEVQPTTHLPVAGEKLNGTRDLVTVDRVVAFLLDDGGVTLDEPENSVAPVIEGTFTGPFTVTSNGTWSNSPDSYTYQWQADGEDIEGETEDTLAADDAYDAVDITCDVVATNPAGSSDPVASNTIVGELEV